MATFTFSNKSQKSSEQKPVKKNDLKKNVKINLIKHDRIEYSPEYYTYVNSNNEVCKYSGILYKEEDGSYIGKNITTHKVLLTFHPTVKSVDYKAEYFSYIDIYGKERIFTGTPLFNLETNTYYGEVQENNPVDTAVKIYKEV